MKKIPTLFVRDPDDRKHVLPKVTPGCEWVMNGEGVATRKYDGTCVSWHDGDWWFRREVKPGKPAPDGWVEADHDDATSKRVGWEPARPESSFIKPLREAIEQTFEFGQDIPEGTYELCGPKINGNPERYERHTLIRHAHAMGYPAMNCPAGYGELRGVMSDLPWEGIVWHHPDGRMAKLKVRDFA